MPPLTATAYTVPLVFGLQLSMLPLPSATAAALFRVCPATALNEPPKQRFEVHTAIDHTKAPVTFGLNPATIAPLLAVNDARWFRAWPFTCVKPPPA